MLGFFKKNSIIQKPIAGFLIFIICLSFFSFSGALYPTKKVEAWAGILDTNIEGWPNLFANIWPNVKKAWEYGKKIAATYARKTMLDHITDSIVAWINGEGKPQWLDGNMDDFLVDVADQAGSKILNEIVSKDVMRGLCQPNWAIKINLNLKKPPRFSERMACTLSDIGANFDDFMGDFTNGGWGAWLKVTESQNNPYGLYLTVLNEKLTREMEAAAGAEKEIIAGGGFRGDKVCRQMSYYDTDTDRRETKTGTFTEGDLKDYADEDSDWPMWNVKCDKWETRTPGRIAAAGLKKTVFNDIDWLKSNEDWESYVAAIGDALVNRLITEGVREAKDFASGSQPSAGAPSMPDNSDVDLTPPETNASPFDPWHIQIISEEPVTIVYTTDGSAPSLNSISERGPYLGPIKVLGDIVVKWFGYDEDYNQEDVRTWDPATEPPLGPPFEIAGLTKPVSVWGAVSPSEIALLSNEPSTIYYTLGDEAEQARYIKKINFSISSANNIKWYAVDLDGNQESSQYASLQPPFPGPDPDRLWNMVVPQAGILISSETPAVSTEFLIDPSESNDPDPTDKIVMYEWDIDGDGIYDWDAIDWNRDGIFKAEDKGCTNRNSDEDPPPTCPYRADADIIGALWIKYATAGEHKITLQVTDDEGLSSVTSVIVNVQ